MAGAMYIKSPRPATIHPPDDRSLRHRRRHLGASRASRSTRTGACSRPRRRLPALDAATRLVRAGPRGLVARHRVRARAPARRPPARPPASVCPARCTGWWRSTQHDHVLRPAILWNDQRTQAECEEIEADARTPAADRAHRQPRAAGLHRAEAPVAAPPRARRLRADRPDRPAQGLRPAPPLRRARHRRLRRVRHAAARRRGPPLERGGPRMRSRSTRRWLPPVLESPAVSGHTGRRRAGRGRRAATRRPARSASASIRPGPLSVVLGTSGVVFAALDAFAADPQARVHAFCHAVPGAWHAMGVMLSAAGSLPGCATPPPPTPLRRAPERGRRLAGGHRGPHLPPLPRRRAHPVRRPRRARGVRRTRASATTAARSPAPCSRASRSACATRST